MSEPGEQAIRPSPRLRWLLWFGFATGWSAALLMPIPIEPGTGVRNPTVLFSLAKTLHVLAYATFTLLTIWLPATGIYRGLLVLFLAGHAALGEYLQWSFPSLGRSGSVRDMLLDLAAITVTLMAVAIIINHRGHREHREKRE